MTIDLDLTGQEEEPPRPSLEDASPAVLQKALELITDNRVEVIGEYTWSVRGSAEEPYTVKVGLGYDGLPAWTSCTCPHGMHQTSARYRVGCSHVAAAFIILMLIGATDADEKEEG
jgi:hypothetical protein